RPAARHTPPSPPARQQPSRRIPATAIASPLPECAFAQTPLSHMPGFVVATALSRPSHPLSTAGRCPSETPRPRFGNRLQSTHGRGAELLPSCAFSHFWV